MFTPINGLCDIPCFCELWDCIGKSSGRRLSSSLSSSSFCASGCSTTSSSIPNASRSTALSWASICSCTSLASRSVPTSLSSAGDTPLRLSLPAPDFLLFVVGVFLNVCEDADLRLEPFLVGVGLLALSNSASSLVPSSSPADFLAANSLILLFSFILRLRC